MILFLDDDPCRAALAYQRFKPTDREKTIWCSTVEEAICTLKDYKDLITFVSLGHDFGGKKYVHPAREDSGTEIVRFLEKLYKSGELGGLKNAYFRVHSWNIDAGNNMYKRLKGIKLKTDFVPFGL